MTEMGGRRLGETFHYPQLRRRNGMDNIALCG